ncbi:MAG: hypothetical protein LBB80_00595 [Treponema sp.]|nr:hypothetical protein [Treponema sp.]
MAATTGGGSPKILKKLKKRLDKKITVIYRELHKLPPPPALGNTKPADRVGEKGMGIALDKVRGVFIGGMGVALLFL